MRKPSQDGQSLISFSIMVKFQHPDRFGIIRDGIIHMMFSVWEHSDTSNIPVHITMQHLVSPGTIKFIGAGIFLTTTVYKMVT